MNKIRLAAVAAAIGTSLMITVVASGSVKPPTAGTAAQVAKLVKASHSVATLSSTLERALPAAANNNVGIVYPATWSGCPTLMKCVFGDTTSSKTLVLLGDSHAQMWLPALIRIGATHKLKVVLLYLPVCPAATLDVWSSTYHAPYKGCTTTRSAWIEDLNKLHPAAIVLAERTYGIYSAASGGTQLFTDAQWTQGLETTIATLQPSGAKIAVLGDIITFDSPVPACLAAHPSAVQLCSVPAPNSARPNHQGAEKAAAKAEKVLFVNPMPWLCTTTCSPVIGKYIAYYDQYHVSVTYDAYLSGVLQTALKSIL